MSELQVDFKVDRPPPADSPPGDLLITMAVFFLPKVFCVPGRKFVDLDAS